MNFKQMSKEINFQKNFKSKTDLMKNQNYLYQNQNQTIFIQNPQQLSNFPQQKCQNMLYFPQINQSDLQDQLSNQFKESQQKYKTELCKKFIQNGFCNYKEKCRFAHGYIELRQKTHVNQKYKTRSCKNFIEKGYCNYGSRCQFIHDHSLNKNQNQMAKNQNYFQLNEKNIDIWDFKNNQFDPFYHKEKRLSIFYENLNNTLSITENSLLSLEHFHQQDQTERQFVSDFDQFMNQN